MTVFTRNTVSLSLTACVSLFCVSGADADDSSAEDRTSATSPSEISTSILPPIEKSTLPIHDVSLSEDGVLRGRVLSGDGKPVDGARVVIRQGNELLRKLVTNDKGQFEAQDLRAGVYTIATIQGSGLYRLWPKNIAPPSARTQALVVTQKPIMRAQFNRSDLTRWAAIGTGVAGLTFGIISYEKVKDLEDEVDALKSP